MSGFASVRTRFAPSPTGPLHIGGARSAIFSWLLAKRHGGQFILRLEDTDRKRYVPGSEAEIYEGLRWLGLEWDEGPDIGGPFAPYVQSERKSQYQAVSQELIQRGHAYPCFCSAERLAAVNEQRRSRKEASGYDRHCRNISASQAARRMANGEAHVIRLKAPRTGETCAMDLIRGSLSYENERLQDTVLLKSDGLPTYHLAVVVDDHSMRISHVTRAVEWLSSFPIHVLLWQMLEWPMPAFAHLPVLLNPNGKGKLSKRHAGFRHNGQSVPVLLREFKEEGYYGPAVANFLTNIGWSFGDNRELFTPEQAAERFDVTKVNAANSAFPVDKLHWLNGVYIRERMTREDLRKHVRIPLQNAGYGIDEEKLEQILPLIQPRIKTFNDAVPMAGFFFADEFVPPTLALLHSSPLTPEEILQSLHASRGLLSRCSAFKAKPLYERFADLANQLGMKKGPLFGTIRMAITGQSVSPPAFETMEIIGKEECLRRLDLSIQTLETPSTQMQ
ncbi:MAG: glutamate--tRNA ligase [Chloroflexi bacterium]|nr:glutamate--tRNA ligase [Chloroflexota bacterium]